jgi:hypothetical protein
MAAIALVGAAVWSAIDERSKRRTEYQTAYSWLRLLLRFTLALDATGVWIREGVSGAI